ncbi:hypothetical protein BX667DRAFT_340047 [Coemansia mojavensis]|nr:hypothetical protein BX667DRAFT_340047 [Coemansia mojavensis]
MLFKTKLALLVIGSAMSLTILYYLHAQFPLNRRGFVYYLPITSFVDGKWIRMNRLLADSYKVCDDSTTIDPASHLSCDMTVSSPAGWKKLCFKTRAMFEEICRTKSYKPYKFLVKTDDDAIMDPLVENFISSEYEGGNVYFGTTYGPNTSYDPQNNTWFGGWFYGVNTEVIDKICECGLPQCISKMGEDQWFGYTLGQCNIEKRDLVVPEDFVHHKEYSTKRLNIKFTAIR